MAYTDKTRTNDLHQKKGISVFAGVLAEGTGPDNIAAASGNYLIGNLPPNAIINDAYIQVLTASDAATSAVATLGTAEAGTEVLSAGDLTVEGKAGTFTGNSVTGSGKPLYLGVTITGAATAVAEYVVVVEYIEYTKNTGEFTKIN